MFSLSALTFQSKISNGHRVHPASPLCSYHVLLCSGWLTMSPLYAFVLVFSCLTVSAFPIIPRASKSSLRTKGETAFIHIYIFKPHNACADLFKLHTLEHYSRGSVCTCSTIHFVPLQGDCVSSTKRLDGDVQLFSWAGYSPAAPS